MSEIEPKPEPVSEPVSEPKSEAETEIEKQPAPPRKKVKVHGKLKLDLDGLSVFQQRFVKEYMVDYCARDAIVRAGYKGDNSGTRGSNMLRNKRVRAKIAKEQEKMSKKLEITQERILHEYEKIAFANVRDVVEWDKNKLTLKKSSTLSEDTSAAIEEVSITNNRGSKAVKVRMHDKKGALDSLARHLGLFNDKIELRGSNNKPISFINITAIGGSDGETVPDNDGERR